MNCETISLMLNAALDGELSEVDRARMREHLSECGPCREHLEELNSVDESLKTALTPGSVEPEIARLMRAISMTANDPRSHLFDDAAASVESSITLPRPNLVRRGTGLSPSPRPAARGVFVMLICTLIIVAGVMLQLPAECPAVAEITMSTGPVDVMRANAGEWTTFDGSSRVPLSAHARIRTRQTSTCEIRTKSDAVVRVNHETELVLCRPEKIELVSGELWCRASVGSGMEISSETMPRHRLSDTVFTCPSSSVTQWTASSDEKLRCLGVSPTPIDLKANPAQASCTVQPGESCVFAGGHALTDAMHFDLLDATSWQLPLLALRNPDDRELRQRLIELLALVGQSKVSYLYEDQIRQLGPAGTVPLLAFVRSADPSERPELRQRAMQIISELAPASSQRNLEDLLKDADPVVRQLARLSLQRIQPDRQFRD